MSPGRVAGPLRVLTADAVPADRGAFLALVLAAAPPTVPDEVWAVLLSDALARRTKTALTDLLNDLAQTAAEKRQSLPTHRYMNWRRITGDRQRVWLETRTRAARAALIDLHTRKVEQEQTAGRRIAVQLAMAIQQHRLAAVTAGIEAEPHDRALWSRLAELSLDVGGRPMVLDDAIGAGHWRDLDGPR